MITATSPSAICICVVHTVGSLEVSYATTTRACMLPQRRLAGATHLQILDALLLLRLLGLP